MVKVSDMTSEDLEHFVEQKLLEFLGDPDVNLQLNEDFRKKLEERLAKPTKRMSHSEVIERFGKG